MRASSSAVPRITPSLEFGSLVLPTKQYYPHEVKFSRPALPWWTELHMYGKRVCDQARPYAYFGAITHGITYTHPEEAGTL